MQYVVPLKTATELPILLLAMGALFPEIKDPKKVGSLAGFEPMVTDSIADVMPPAIDDETHLDMYFNLWCWEEPKYFAVNEELLWKLHSTADTCHTMAKKRFNEDRELPSESAADAYDLAVTADILRKLRNATELAPAPPY
jgi:hypothetical protein